MDELNERFRQAGTRLNYHNGLIQVGADPLVEREIERPFWRLVADARWKNVGLLDEAAPLPVPEHEYSFQLVADEDPNLALAGLRIEIERKLNQLVEAAGLRTGSTSPRVNVGRALKVLGDAGILTHDQSSVLSDMIGLLNSAVHGAKVDQQSARWALEVGSRLLASLEKRRPPQ